MTEQRDTTQPAGGTSLDRHVRRVAEEYVTADMFRNATLTAEAEALARRGGCPSCKRQSLKLKHEGAGMLFHHCEGCGCIVVLNAPNGAHEQAPVKTLTNAPAVRALLDGRVGRLVD